jgi:NADH-quinone oxidoreductase subunit C
MSEMNNEYLLREINAKFADAVLQSEEPYGMLTLDIEPSKILDLLKYLYEHNELRVRFLTDICGAHYPGQPGKELAIIYHLHSLENNLRFRLKCFVPVADPKVPSLTPLYNSANWMERETYDYYGVNFTGHPNLVRILNVDEMDYFPLRKEYPLEDQTRTDKDDKYFGR